MAAAAAVEHVGPARGRLNLAQAAIYLARAPKSNASYRAIGAAREFVREHGGAPPPVQLRSGGRGQGYDNPHAHAGHLTAQELAPERAVGSRFYTPTTRSQSSRRGLRRSVGDADERAVTHSARARSGRGRWAGGAWVDSARCVHR